MTDQTIQMLNSPTAKSKWIDAKTNFPKKDGRYLISILAMPLSIFGVMSIRMVLKT